MDDFISYLESKYRKKYAEDEVRSDPVLMTIYAAFYAGKWQATRDAVEWLTREHGRALGRHNYYAHAANSIKHLYRK